MEATKQSINSTSIENQPKAVDRNRFFTQDTLKHFKLNGIAATVLNTGMELAMKYSPAVAQFMKEKIPGYGKILMALGPTILSFIPIIYEQAKTARSNREVYERLDQQGTIDKMTLALRKKFDESAATNGSVLKYFNDELIREGLKYMFLTCGLSLYGATLNYLSSYQMDNPDVKETLEQIPETGMTLIVALTAGFVGNMTYKVYSYFSSPVKNDLDHAKDKDQPPVPSV